MRIHTVKRGETLHEIARLYGVTPAKIIENNGLSEPDRLSVGEKLLILTPTRTYTVRGGDTLERICRRFEVSACALKRTNPYLSVKKMTYPEQVIAIKYDAPSYRCAIFNGYYYRDTPRERLDFALAVSDMITVSAYRQGGVGIERLYNDSDIIKMVLNAGRTPIMRIYFPGGYETFACHTDKLVNDITERAKSSGYGGVCIAARQAEEHEGFGDFLVKLKRRLMIENLSLIIESDRADTALSEIADFYVLLYEKCCLKEIPSFDEGERRFFTHYADSCDSTRTLIDLNAFGYVDGEAKTHSELHATAYRLGREIRYDDNKKISYFECRGRGAVGARAIFEAPENIKAKLELAAELGFGGISFDIMRVPMAHLMMAVSLFASAHPFSAEI